MNEVEFVSMSGDKFKRIALVEFLAAIVRLLLNIHADDVESRQLITARGATGAAEQIERDQHEALTIPTA
ncbi:MAG: hypothetical protein BWY25_02571 [Chloroflexi bacterium ADurb.Bin222]|nr:MAG: hypothetical protein BWY25_02571 [Chloroflexi bacterium ADurb.Bin222]